MKRFLVLGLLCAILIGCAPQPTGTPERASGEDAEVTNVIPTASPDEVVKTDDINEEAPESFTPTPTPDPFSSLYGCEMEIKFVSGPLEAKSAAFTVLDQDYFFDKEDKFDPGQGTGIYYGFLHYFILHSSYVNGNILRPMEAEFLRKYLEYWGVSGNAYIQSQMDSLEGSEVIWFCNGEQIFTTEINGLVRLSHEASEDLWMDPENLEQILIDREGLTSEWIGEFDEINRPYLYIGFCGWGPDSLGDERYTYYRYLIRFEVMETYTQN